MALPNIKTGQTATPLQQLQEINEERRQQTENGLLKEALAISNERCNTLVSLQNTLILDLTASVNEIKGDNSFYAKRLGESVQTAVREMRALMDQYRF